ncbi:MAG TPA: hypothetical protein VGJ60_07110 [Chloroflexota bacterium]|jgi:hypothetical protein
MPTFTASCIACGEFTSSARSTRSGLMCRACARFMRAPLDELAPEPLVQPYVPPAHLEPELEEVA